MRFIASIGDTLDLVLVLCPLNGNLQSGNGRNHTRTQIKFVIQSRCTTEQSFIAKAISNAVKIDGRVFCYEATNSFVSVM